MSSETSSSRPLPLQQGIQPWQFFAAAAFACAAALAFLVRGEGFLALVLLILMMATVALVGAAGWRTLRPLVSPDEDRTVMIGHRTRAALEREKMLVLRAIKELEFDRAMGKLSEPDWKEMSARLRARAVGLMRQLDAGSGYRDQIERELAERVGRRMRAGSGAAAAVGCVCAACATGNDPDARFCKTCGIRL
jgi:hypothetical protein